jgi:hypothetical protein
MKCFGKLLLGIGIVLVAYFILSDPVVSSTWVPSPCNQTEPNFMTCVHEYRPAICEHHLFGSEVCIPEKCSTPDFGSSWSFFPQAVSIYMIICSFYVMYIYLQMVRGESKPE